MTKPFQSLYYVVGLWESAISLLFSRCMTGGMKIASFSV